MPAPGQKNNTQPMYASNIYTLNQFIRTVNNDISGSEYEIRLTENFEYIGNPIPINTISKLTICPRSSGTLLLDATGYYHGFTVLSGIVTLSRLILVNMTFSTEPGCLGAGAGLFVANLHTLKPARDFYGIKDTGQNTQVTLDDVTFSNCNAYGGAPNGEPEGGAGGQGAAAYFSPGSGQPGTRTTSTYARSRLTPENFDANGDTLAGCFGMVGLHGYGGAGGQNGQVGKPGGTGGNGGYGAAGGNGGGGGGGSGSNCSDLECDAGMQGGEGGPTGLPGFMCATLAPAQAGSIGGEAGVVCGGDGGKGGRGGMSSGGAALGGAIFTMSNAILNIRCTTLDTGITHNNLHGGTGSKWTGRDGFFQGSGTIDVTVARNRTFTLGYLKDENGAPNVIDTITQPSVGADQLPQQAQNGSWIINKYGKGTLKVGDEYGLSGKLSIHDGEVDLSQCIGANCETIQLKAGATLEFKPAKASNLVLKQLETEPGATIRLGPKATLKLARWSAKAGETHLEIDPQDFDGIDRLRVIECLDKDVNASDIKVTDGFSIEGDANSLWVVRSE